jgi:hypothetical protein
MTHVDREGVLRRRHAWLWERVFTGDAAQLPRATIRLIEECGTSGYSRPDDTILFYLGGFDLDHLDTATDETPSLAALDRWRIWEIEVLHELVHEYQAKVVAGAVTQEGHRLRDIVGTRYAGHGHDADFYTAIAAVAAKLAIDPQVLVNQL